MLLLIIIIEDACGDHTAAPLSLHFGVDPCGKQASKASHARTSHQIKARKSEQAKQASKKAGMKEGKNAEGTITSHKVKSSKSEQAQPASQQEGSKQEDTKAERTMNQPSTRYQFDFPKVGAHQFSGNTWYHRWRVATSAGESQIVLVASGWWVGVGGGSALGAKTSKN